MRESEVEAHLVRVARLCGGMVRKVAWIGRVGAPDRVVFLPGGVSFWIELKAPKKTAESHQVREHERLTEFGQRVAVLDTVKKVDDFFTPYFHPVSRQQ